jgi:hypothetical protein
MNCKGCGRKRSGTNLRFYPGICLEAQRKIKKNIRIEYLWAKDWSRGPQNTAYCTTTFGVCLTNAQWDLQLMEWSSVLRDRNTWLSERHPTESPHWRREGDKYLAKEGKQLILSACYRLRHVVTLITVFSMTVVDMVVILIQEPCILDFIDPGHNVAFDHQVSEKWHVSQ